ncbi:hypothetical protein E1A91_D04G128600v1 [Gossypium mustelinum]|uniref:Zinc knuckle CX2CX4HX4C domain-containing protein n=1 Tax=Gossypium mustelinum TaxID=34275 RepID=A0A5D2VDB9_GOSMU|nr:hypothetical protein E1A91_D04G128600v1 [Gossypium mustelinum]
MADVEGDFKGLSLEDAEEEEVVRLKEPVSGTGESLDNCLVGSFLTSSVVNFVYESHFGECLASYTISDLSDGRFLYRLFHKGKVLPNGTIRYVKFAYEKLTLFCFLCGKLGHKESFYLLHVLQDDQELSFSRENSLKAPFRRAVALSNRWLREKGAGAPGMEGRNFRGNTPIMGNIGVRLVRSSNRQLRANLGRVNEENLNPNVLLVGYGQSQGLIRRNNMDLVITQDKPSNGLSSGGFGDVMGEDNPMVNGEGLKQPLLHLANSERNDNRNGDEYQNEISADLAQRANREQ